MANSSSNNIVNYPHAQAYARAKKGRQLMEDKQKQINASVKEEIKVVLALLELIKAEIERYDSVTGLKRMAESFDTLESSIDNNLVKCNIFIITRLEKFRDKLVSEALKTSDAEVHQRILNKIKDLGWKTS